MKISLNYKYLIIVSTLFLILSTPLAMISADISAFDSDIAIIDSAIYYDYPDNNYGSGNFLDIQESAEIFSLVYFDVSHFSGITEALFKIYIPAGGVFGTDVNVNIHIILNNWTESVVTWNNFGGAAAYEASVNASLGPINAVDTWYSVDITPLAQAWHNGDIPNNGILLQTDTAGAWLGPRSSENANGPTLDTTYDSYVSEINSSLLIPVIFTTLFGCILVIRRKK